MLQFAQPGKNTSTQRI